MTQIEFIKDSSADLDDLDEEQGEQFEYQLKSIDPKGWYLEFSIKFNEPTSISQEGDLYDQFSVSIKPEIFQQLFRLANNKALEFDRSRSTLDIRVRILDQDIEQYEKILATQ